MIFYCLNALLLFTDVSYPVSAINIIPLRFAPVSFASTLVSFRLLIARHLLLGRYLILLDRFLADFTPQEIEAMTMPTLEEVRATLDARGSQLVQQALASVPGKSGLVMCIHAPCRNFHEFSTIVMLDSVSTYSAFPSTYRHR